MAQTGVTRSKYIRDRVGSILGTFGDDPIGEDEIFFIATEKSREIAERFLCVESSLNLSILAGTADYDLKVSGGNPTGFHRLKLLAAPLNSYTIFEEVDMNLWDYTVRYARAITGLYRIIFKIWNGVLSFYPIPNQNGTYTLYFYKSPTTVISETVAPETPSMFDSAIIYATVAELGIQVGKKDLVGEYLQLFENEMTRANENWRTTKQMGNQILYHDV